MVLAQQPYSAVILSLFSGNVKQVLGIAVKFLLLPHVDLCVIPVNLQLRDCPKWG